jgi:hypothetical protein
VTGYLIKKRPVPTKRAAVCLVNVKSCDELLRMLLVCITATCLRSVLSFVLNFGYLFSGHHVYVSKDERIRGCFSNPDGVREQKRLGNTDVDLIMV